jgi:uncharacterized LabA/DUF88 family protein
MKKHRQRRGLSYKKRVADINRIYDHWVKTGLSNREIWRRYIYPAYAISERQLYNILNASADPKNEIPPQEELWLKFDGYDERDRQGGEPDTEGHQGGAWR